MRFLFSKKNSSPKFYLASEKIATLYGSSQAPVLLLRKCISVAIDILSSERLRRLCTRVSMPQQRFLLIQAMHCILMPFYRGAQKAAPAKKISM